MTFYTRTKKKTSEIPAAAARHLRRVEREENQQQLQEVCRPSKEGDALRAVLGRIVERLGEDRLPDSYEEAHGF